MIGKKLWAIVHFIMLLVLLYWNYLAQNGSLPYTIQEISTEFTTLFTPAAYTFSIWGLIYLGLLFLAVYSIYMAFKKNADNSFIERSLPYLFFSYFLTTIWLWFWGNNQLMYALVMMFLILGNLLLIVLRLRMNLWNPPLTITLFVWWPIHLFFGWICVASIANTAVYLQKVKWNAWGLDPTSWTYLMIAVVCLLGLKLIALRNMREVAYVFIWALVGIAVKNWGTHSDVSLLCLAGAFSLFVFNFYHAIQNKQSLIWKKERQ